MVEAAAYITPTQGGYEYRLIDVAEVVPPGEVAQALDSGNDLAVMRHRLLLYGDEPVELSWSYYPIAIARGTELAGRRRIAGDAARVLADSGHRQRDLHDRISARMPTIEEVEALALPPYVPVIRQFRVIRDGSGRPIEVSILIKGSHLTNSSTARTSRPRVDLGPVTLTAAAVPPRRNTFGPQALSQTAQGGRRRSNTKPPQTASEGAANRKPTGSIAGCPRES